MYATISDLIADLFGLNIPLPIQTFGFLMALAFVFVSFSLMYELKRKEKLGKIPTSIKRTLKGGDINLFDWATSAIIAFIIGYKLLDAVLNYSEFVNNPQIFILSMRGCFLGGFLAIGIAFYTKYKDSKKEKIKYPKPTWEEQIVHPHELTTNIIVLAAVTGLFGAKIFHNLEYIDEFLQDPIGAMLSFSGLTFYGSVIVGAIGVIWYTKKKGIKPLHMIDITVPGLALGYGIGRLGCHLSGDGDWGIVANWGDKMPGFFPDWFWAYNFPNNVINAGVPMEGCVSQHCFVLPEAVYPTSLWEAIFGIAMFGILWFLSKKINIAGMLFSIYLILQGIERYFIEGIRVNSEYHILGNGITQAELISLFMILLGAVSAGYFYMKREKFSKY